MRAGKVANSSTGMLAIGWDVRGWRGSQQAVAVLAIHSEAVKVERWWVSEDFQFKPGEELSLASLLQPAMGENYTDIIRQYSHIVMGIDAPLAYPSRFIELIDQSSLTTTSQCEPAFIPAAREIDNPLAYRDCERWVHNEYGKKPLSASFDKLGNGATLALAMCQALQIDGFIRVPQQGDFSERSIIEVYPALHKCEHRRDALAIAPLHGLIPSSVTPGTDQYDASICALLAATSRAGGVMGLPGSLPQPESYPSEEGWIYSLPCDYIRQHAS